MARIEDVLLRSPVETGMPSQGSMQQVPVSNVQSPYRSRLIGADQPSWGAVLGNLGETFNSFSKQREEKRDKEDFIAGQMANMEGKTLADLKANGVSNMTEKGYVQAGVSINAQEWFARKTAELPLSAEKTPEQYRSELQEEFRGSLTGAQYTDNVTTAFAAEMMPKLVANQTMAYMEYQEGRAFNTARDLMVATAANGFDAKPLITESARKTFGLSEDRMNQAISEAVVQSYNLGSSALPNAIGLSDQSLLTREINTSAIVNLPEDISNYVATASSKYNVPVDLALAVLSTESGGKHFKAPTQRYGRREDGTQKDVGFFGELKMKDGTNRVATEMAMTFDYGEGDVLVPLLNPLLTKEEVNSLLLGEEPTKEIKDKTHDWGLNRIKTGKSPFATHEDNPSISKEGRDEMLTSSAGARGLMQLMPETARDIESRYDVDTSTPEGNIEGGVAYLSEQLREFDGNFKHALMAYNWGPTSVRRWIRGGETGAVPEETQKYVNRILKDTTDVSDGAGSVGAIHGKNFSYQQQTAMLNARDGHYTAQMKDALVKAQMAVDKMYVELESGNITPEEFRIQESRLGLSPDVTAELLEKSSEQLAQKHQFSPSEQVDLGILAMQLTQANVQEGVEGAGKALVSVYAGIGVLADKYNWGPDKLNFAKQSMSQEYSGVVNKAQAEMDGKVTKARKDIEDKLIGTQLATSGQLHLGTKNQQKHGIAALDSAVQQEIISVLTNSGQVVDPDFPGTNKDFLEMYALRYADIIDGIGPAVIDDIKKDEMAALARFPGKDVPDSYLAGLTLFNRLNNKNPSLAVKYAGAEGAAIAYRVQELVDAGMDRKEAVNAAFAARNSKTDVIADEVERSIRTAAVQGSGTFRSTVLDTAFNVIDSATPYAIQRLFSSWTADIVPDTPANRDHITTAMSSPDVMNEIVTTSAKLKVKDPSLSDSGIARAATLAVLNARTYVGGSFVRGSEINRGNVQSDMGIEPARQSPYAADTAFNMFMDEFYPEWEKVSWISRTASGILSGMSEAISAATFVTPTTTPKIPSSSLPLPSEIEEEGGMFSQPGEVITPGVPRNVTYNPGSMTFIVQRADDVLAIPAKDIGDFYNKKAQEKREKMVSRVGVIRGAAESIRKSAQEFGGPYEFTYSTQ